MAFSAGFNSRIMAGSLNLSCETRDASVSSTTEALDVTTFCDGPDKTFVPGADTSTFTASGPLDVDGSTNEPFDLLTSWSDDGSPVTFGVAGLDAGDPAWLMSGLQTSFDTSTSVSGIVEFSLSTQVTGPTGIGQSLGLETLTASGDGDAVDFGAAGTNGAILQLNVSSWTGLTSDTIIVEQSTNGSTGWTTLGSFTVATGITSERITVSGSVARYLRAADTVVGSGSVIRCVSAAIL